MRSLVRLFTFAAVFFFFCNATRGLDLTGLDSVPIQEGGGARSLFSFLPMRRF